MRKSPSPSPRSVPTVSTVPSPRSGRWLGASLTALTVSSVLMAAGAAALLAACSSDTGPSTLTDAEAQQVGYTMVSQISALASSFTASENVEG